MDVPNGILEGPLGYYSMYNRKFIGFDLTKANIQPGADCKHTDITNDIDEACEQCILKYERQIQDIKMRYFKYRLQSYYKWPLTFISTTSLSETGFYYMNRADRVRCFECHLELHMFEVGDQPKDEHKRLSPSCPMVKGLSLKNIN